MLILIRVLFSESTVSQPLLHKQDTAHMLQDQQIIPLLPISYREAKHQQNATTFNPKHRGLLLVLQDWGGGQGPNPPAAYTNNRTLPLPAATGLAARDCPAISVRKLNQQHLGRFPSLTNYRPSLSAPIEAPKHLTNQNIHQKIRF